MPELPEVELVAKSLDKLVSKKRIRRADLLRERLAPAHSVEEFGASLSGSKINYVHRRGKHVLFDLDSGLTLLTHLRMTGRFLLLAAEREFPKHTHAAFGFDDETKLVFQDQRHFGMMKIVPTCDLSECRELKKLAPEPFSDDFSIDYLRCILEKSKKPLKEVLLDQTKVCGVGNIYASESLFRARINPILPAAELSPRKSATLHTKIREVLAESIAHGSTMDVDPENIDGSYYGGAYEGRWQVYDREKEPCPRCQTAIERIVQNGRSTYYCPKCQC